MAVRERVTALVSTCQRHVSRAALRLKTAAGGGHLSRRFASTALLSRRVSDEIVLVAERMKKRLRGRCGWGRGSCSRAATTEIWDGEEEEEGVWKRTILMGEKCQPLEFSGVIYYDCKGRRLVAPPRSPLRSPLAVADRREEKDDSLLKQKSIGYRMAL